MLIGHGASLYWSDGTLLHIAARCRRREHALILLSEALRRGGEEALHTYAAATSKKTGATALLIAAMVGAQDIVDILLTRFPNLLLCAKNDGMTALGMAAWNGFPETVKMLMEQGGNELLFHKDERGWTCLHRAVEQGHVDVIALLVERGGKPLVDSPDKANVTCANLAETLWGPASKNPRPKILVLLQLNRQ